MRISPDFIIKFLRNLAAAPPPLKIVFNLLLSSFAATNWSIKLGASPLPLVKSTPTDFESSSKASRVVAMRFVEVKFIPLPDPATSILEALVATPLSSRVTLIPFTSDTLLSNIISGCTPLPERSLRTLPPRALATSRSSIFENFLAILTTSALIFLLSILKLFAYRPFL